MLTEPTARRVGHIIPVMRRIAVLITVAAVLIAGGYALAHALSGEAEVRITARRLADGRTEFALQQRTSGEWGERQLPRGRYFPAEASPGRWLHSTPIEITTEAEEQAAGLSNPSDRVRLGVEANGGSEEEGLVWFHGDAGVVGLRTAVVVLGDTDHRTSDQGQLYMGCDDEVRSLWFQVGVGFPTTNGWHSATLADEGTLRTAWGTVARWQWRDAPEWRLFGGSAWLVANARQSWLNTARSQRWFSIVLPTASGDQIRASFDLSGLFDTPVQHLLDQCES